MFCSTIIPTINRPTLSRAINSVLEQNFPKDEFEVIVVNDSGKDLVDLSSFYLDKLCIIHTNKRERCFARNAGAAIAKGQYLLFLDDDDWLAQDALKSFYELCKDGFPPWLSGGFTMVDEESTALQYCQPDDSGNCLIRLLAGEWIPLQSSMIRTDIFFEVGGFNPSFLVTQDNVLWATIAISYDVKFIKRNIFFYTLSNKNTTTNYSKLSRNLRRLCENILEQPRIYHRIQNSAETRQLYKDYWYGKAIQIYLKSILFNIDQLKLFTCLQKFTIVVYFMLLCIKYWISKNFWKGLLGKHNARNGWMRKDLEL
jgi:glycosyltransferase involved in cell wall biosynthesis